MLIKKLYILPFLLLLFNTSKSTHPIPKLFSVCKQWAYETRWNWNFIDYNKVMDFPSNFIWGTGDSAYQTEGTQTAGDQPIINNWTLSDKQIVIRHGKYVQRTPIKNRVGNGTERWTRYPDDIKLAKDIGMNSFRFSIEWSKIEPQKGIFNKQAMDHYIEFTQELIAQGIQPIPTLFHHTWPDWFEYKGDSTRGFAFEDEQNIQDFVDFAVYVFNAFKENGLLEKTKLWLTFNEPAGYALAAYLYGKYPPYKKITTSVKQSLTLCGTVLKNMLDAHVILFHTFKEIDPSIKISLAHMMQPLQPYNPFNPLDLLSAKMFDYLLNDVTLIYLQKGNLTGCV